MINGESHNTVLEVSGNIDFSSCKKVLSQSVHIFSRIF